MTTLKAFIISLAVITLTACGTASSTHTVGAIETDRGNGQSYVGIKKGNDGIETYGSLRVGNSF